MQTSRLRLVIRAYETNCVSIYEFAADDAGDRAEDSPSGSLVNTNAAGGKAFFLPAPDTAMLQAALNQAQEVYDVSFDRCRP